MTSFEKKRADLIQDLLCFSKIFLQSFRYVNGCAILFYQEGQCHENDRRELFEILSNVTLRAVELLLSYVSRLGAEEGLPEEVALLCYLFEVALFWVREVAGMHFLINVSFPNEQLTLLPLLLNYLQFHPSQHLVRLLYQLLRSTAASLNLAPLTHLPEELKEVVTSFQSQIVTILLDTCISLPTLHRILGAPSPASSSTWQAVSSLLEEKQRQHIHYLLHLLTHSLVSEENNQDKTFALLLLEECLLQLYADLSPQLSTSLNRMNSAAKWFLFDGVHLARSLCCHIPNKLEVHSELLKGMWSQSNGVVTLLSRISAKDWQFISQDEASLSTGGPDMKWRGILDEDILHCTRWCEEMRSRPQLPEPTSASCLSYCSSQNSFLAFSSVLQCLIDLFITVWKGRKQRYATTPLVLLPSEHDLSAWRDCLQRLLSSGHWEIGLALTQFLLHLIELTCDRQSSWYKLVEIFPGSSSTPIPSSATSSPRADILPQSTPRAQFNFTFSPMKTSSSSSLKSLISPRPSGPALSKSKSFKSLPASTSPPPPELLLRTQSQSQLLRQASPAPPPPPSHSPFKRKDHFRQELQRLVSKFKDKIKFDGNQRFPKQYAAVRLLSCAVGNEEGMGNWSSETVKSLSILPQHRDFFHRIELFNSLNYSINASRQKEGGEEEELMRGETEGRWKETWLLFSFDMTSYARAAEYYTDDSLAALSVNHTSSEKEEDKLISLLSPLALGKIIVEVRRYSTTIEKDNFVRTLLRCRITFQTIVISHPSIPLRNSLLHLI